MSMFKLKYEINDYAEKIKNHLRFLNMLNMLKKDPKNLVRDSL
jgi:hypothetical protein